jgi:Putative beta barrel porin-7 (BBP7)
MPNRMPKTWFLSLLALACGYPAAAQVSEFQQATGTAPKFASGSGNGNGVAVLPNSEGEFPPLLAVPAQSVPVKGRKNCRNGCPTDYNPAMAYLPDQNPDYRHHRHTRSGCDSGCDTCHTGWFGAAYFFGTMSDLGEAQREASHGFTLSGGLWLDSDMTTALQFGGLFVTDSFRRWSVDNIEVTSYASVSTGDAAYRHAIFEHDHLRIDALVGYRFLQVFEKFRLRNGTSDTEWKTWNNVHLGQIGLAADWRTGPYSAEIATRVGFGTNTQTAKRQGVTTFTDSPFVVVPEVTVNLGYQLGEGVRSTLGYQLIYLGDALRPANRDESHFLLQGLTLGLEMRY